MASGATVIFLLLKKKNWQTIFTWNGMLLYLVENSLFSARADEGKVAQIVPKMTNLFMQSCLEGFAKNSNYVPNIYIIL